MTPARHKRAKGRTPRHLDPDRVVEIPSQEWTRQEHHFAAQGFLRIRSTRAAHPLRIYLVTHLRLPGASHDNYTLMNIVGRYHLAYTGNPFHPSILFTTQTATTLGDAIPLTRYTPDRMLVSRPLLDRTYTLHLRVGPRFKGGHLKGLNKIYGRSDVTLPDNTFDRWVALLHSVNPRLARIATLKSDILPFTMLDRDDLPQYPVMADGLRFIEACNVPVSIYFSPSTNAFSLLTTPPAAPIPPTIPIPSHDTHTHDTHTTSHVVHDPLDGDDTSIQLGNRYTATGISLEEFANLCWMEVEATHPHNSYEPIDTWDDDREGACGKETGRFVKVSRVRSDEENAGRVRLYEPGARDLDGTKMQSDREFSNGLWVHD